MMFHGRNIDPSLIFDAQELPSGAKVEYPLNLSNPPPHFIGSMPCDAIENVLVICPECKDTKTVEVDSTVKLSSPPIYTLTCTKCNIQWEANLE